MAKLYSNENFPKRTVQQLRNMGHDVLTSVESGKANQSIPDDQVLSYASSQERILLTLNRKHFIRLHAQYPNHAGIIVCTEDPDFEALAQRIDGMLTTQSNFKGYLARINRPQSPKDTEN